MKKIFNTEAIITEVLILLFMTSCTYYIDPPYTSSTWVSDITAMSATAESRIIWDGGSDLRECGFCWNTSGYPTKADFWCEANMENERFSVRLENLSGGTKYYVRSYAKNKAGLFYGEVKSFTTIAYKLPSVSAPWVFFVSHNSAMFSGGGVSYDNTYNILSKGICWSTSINPTINDPKLDLGAGFGDLGGIIEGLTPGTVYYLRAYATNVVGTTYGENKVIRTFDGFTTDFEGHVYSTVRLGKQEWINRNLETAYFSNGDRISTTGTPTVNIEQEVRPLYQWPFQGYDDHPELLDDYGRLYTWYTATDSRKICPTGWHLPSIDEWDELLVHMGGDAATYGILSSSSNYYWGSPLYAGATEGSFLAQLAGFRTVNGQFQYGSNYGTYWWSSTEISSENVYSIYCGKSAVEKVVKLENSKKNGFSVRCVKD
jgi:uncharacterized protein (TIGR02145 family)